MSEAAKSKAAEAVSKQDVCDEQEMMDIDLSRWDNNHYLMRQDELADSVEILNAISRALRLSAMVLPSHYHSLAPRLRDLVWGASDKEPINASGSVSHVLKKI
jgi:hypothetical protein